MFMSNVDLHYSHIFAQKIMIQLANVSLGHALK